MGKTIEKLSKNARNNTVFVGLSGGVDSSVAAYLLKAKPDEFEKLTGHPAQKGFGGFDVVGVHLRCWNVNGCDVDEADDARRVANHLKIPFYVFDLEKEYKRRVVDYMVDGYKRGLTPNPDIMCNKEIKFGLFLDKAIQAGADYIATGHYVKMQINDGNYELFTAHDATKDQSYFLWTLTQELLRHVLFPLGGLTKREVRRIAKKVKLPTADKKDSQGICFIGQVSLKDFLGGYLPVTKGDAVGPDGNIMGTHEGAHFYTIGQRHGLGISGNEPYYVADKNVDTNTVVLAKRDDKILYRKEIEVSGVNIISDKDLPKELLVRIRYRQPLREAKLSKIAGDSYNLTFNKPQEFVAPGQSAVFYSKNGKMLGGGIIEN